MKNDNLTALATLLKNLPSREEFVKSFANVVDRVKRYETAITKDFRDLSTTLTNKIETRLAEVKSGRDGRDGVDGKHGRDGLAGPQGAPGEKGEPGESIVGPAGRDGSPDMAEDVRNKLELLNGDERLDPKAVRGLLERLELLEKTQKETHHVVVGSSGVKQLVAGTGVTIDNTNLEYPTINATGSGGFAVIAITGTINDSNITFTAASQPTLLNINGAFYQKTAGAITWSYSGGTITLSSPVGTGGSIFGI